MVIAADNRTLKAAFEIHGEGEHTVQAADIGPGVKLEASLRFNAQHTGLAIDERGVFSPDGQRYAQVSASSNDLRNPETRAYVYVWDTSTARRTILRQSVRGLPAMAFSADGKTLATGGLDCSVRFWNAETGEAIRDPAEHATPLRSLAVSPDERLLATGSDDDTIRLREIASGKVVQLLKGPMDGVTGLVFLPGGKGLVSRSGESQPKRFEWSTLRVWNYEAGTQPTEIRVPRADTPLACSGDGRYIGFGTGGIGTVADLANQKVVSPPYGEYAAELLPRLRFMVTDWQGYLPVSASGLPALTQASPRGLNAGQMRWHCAAFSPDGNQIEDQIDGIACLRKSGR
jgi:WD40 repeat protein